MELLPEKAAGGRSPMPFLDADALITDPDGMDRLRRCLAQRRPDKVRLQIAQAKLKKTMEKPPVDCSSPPVSASQPADGVLATLSFE
jgi:hypothetical protein